MPYYCYSGLASPDSVLATAEDGLLIVSADRIPPRPMDTASLCSIAARAAVRQRCWGQGGGLVSKKTRPAAAKAAIDFAMLTARLKAAPFQSEFKLSHYRRQATLRREVADCFPGLILGASDRRSCTLVNIQR